MCNSIYHLFARVLACVPAVTLAFAITASTASVAAAAQGAACTDARVNEQQQGLKKFVEENPAQQMAVVNTIAEVENEYGGEVPHERRCEVLDKVLKVLAGGADRRTPIKR